MTETLAIQERQPNNCEAATPRGAARPWVYEIDPLGDPRWGSLLRRNPHASVFQSYAWLDALRRTYGYEPIAFTTSAPDEDLENAIIFCRVESWLTGKRLVSLPFSDYCELLIDDAAKLRQLVGALETKAFEEKWRYIELRPLDSTESFESATILSRSTQEYTYHRLDLTPDLDTIFRNFHKDSTQRKVRRAEREGLEYREGAGDLLDEFYHLLSITRQRHRVPPQPRNWYRNLITCFGDALKIRMAFKDGHAIAGMLTLQYKNVMTYKYGGSDPRYNKFGSMHLLFWKAFQEAKNSGLTAFDFGRTDAAQSGLITFKGRWGSKQSRLIYSRYVLPGKSPAFLDPAVGSWKTQLAKRAFAHMPARALKLAGRVLYKHIG